MKKNCAGISPNLISDGRTDGQISKLIGGFYNATTKNQLQEIISKN